MTTGSQTSIIRCPIDVLRWDSRRRAVAVRSSSSNNHRVKTTSRQSWGLEIQRAALPITRSRSNG